MQTAALGVPFILRQRKFNIWSRSLGLPSGCVRTAWALFFFSLLFFSFFSSVTKTWSLSPCWLTAAVSELRRQPISALSQTHESDAAALICAQHPLLLSLLPPLNFATIIFVMHIESDKSSFFKRLRSSWCCFECASTLQALGPKACSVQASPT